MAKTHTNVLAKDVHMYFPQLALATFLSQANPNAIPPDTGKYPGLVDPADTLLAITLQETPYFVQDTSGESLVWLDSCFTVFRELLTLAHSKGWSGDFTFDALAKRYPALLGYPKLRPAVFRISGKAMYASYMENPGFTPTIGMINDPEAELLEFFYATSKGESRAWAKAL